MRKRRLIILAGVVVAVLALMLPPYLSWQDYEPDIVVTKTEDIEPDLIWDYPWDRGLDISVSWSTSIYEKVEYPYVSTRSPATGLKTVELSASYVNFDIVDVPDWIPTYTYTDTTPDKPSFWDYFSEYYGISTAEVIPTDSLAYGRLSCLFVYYDGEMEGEKEWIDLVPDDPTAKDIIYPFNEAGDYSDSFSVLRRGISGTYTFTFVVMAGTPDTFASIGDDSETFIFINRY